MANKRDQDVPGQVPGVFPGQIPGIFPGQIPGIFPGQVPGIFPGQEPALPSPSIDRRKHPHVLPLVEYGAQGKYVMISPEQGMLSFEPDSPQWFAWLSTLPSFRFVGQQGRFTAFRGYQCSESTPWWAHRHIRNHSHKRRLARLPL